jgi:hypothetical protein
LDVLAARLLTRLLAGFFADSLSCHIFMLQEAQDIESDRRVFD